MGNWYEYNFKGKRVLLVEDHPINAWVEQKLLEKVGFEVIVAEDGQIGVDQFRASEAGYFDAVLMDINMPVMDGLTAAKAIRDSMVDGAEQIPIIAMTTNGYTEDICNSKQAGMNEHLIKPIDPQILFDCLAKYLNVK